MNNVAKNSLDPPCTRLDELLALPMFAAALAFLLIMGALLHLDMGNSLNSTLGLRCAIGLAALYPLFVLEAVAHWLAGSKQLGRHGWYLLMPILRLCTRDHVAGTHVWLPVIGWRKTDRGFERVLTRLFSVPMIVIALLVLPIVGFEFLWQETIAENPWMRFAMQTATGWIWMAFVFEFVVMISVVERKLYYCRKNWIDLAVILLPLLSFMRTARLGRLMKLKQLSRTAKIYRLRGLALRAWRAFVTLDVIDMILRRDPEFRIEKLQAEIHEKQMELNFLKSEMQRLQNRLKSTTSVAVTDGDEMELATASSLSLAEDRPEDHDVAERSTDDSASFRSLLRRGAKAA